mmetsp:Transcript_10386/g.14660  ORF Transcript_10386/g.14660 Transcript_10386/m.14660 type:complete len:166 (-) Transcript_10386:276-773(-)
MLQRAVLLLLFVLAVTVTHSTTMAQEKEVPQEFVDKLKAREELSSLTEEDANKIALILDQARKDDQTLSMVEKMKNDNAKQIMAIKDEMSQHDIMDGLKRTVDDLEALEVLFQNPERAVVELEKEGLIEKKHLKEYKSNPKLLEDDMRKSFYYQFVTLAVAGDYL